MKSQQPNPLNQDDIRDEIESLDQKIEELEASMRSKEQAALSEPLVLDQASALESFDPFLEAIGSLASVWEEVEEILVTSERLSSEIRQAKELGVKGVSVPSSLVALMPGGEFLRGSGIVTGRGDSIRICGRRFIFSRLRQAKVDGMSARDQRALTS